LIANSNISINISSIKNSYTTISSSTFTIYTYYDGPAALVDQLSSGLTITSTPNPIVSANVSSTTYVVKSLSSYTLNITFTNIVLVGTIFNIVFPPEVPISNTTVTFSSSNTLSCTISQFGQIITLNSCINQNTTNNVVFTLGMINNPLSTKPTSSFNITSYYNTSLL
jgi:hypothetical protein